jgi:HEAT repeat protein
LIRALNDEEWTVRLYAASALGQLSERSAVVPLISALMDAERRVVIQAANALGRIGDPQAVGPVIGALSRSENSGDKEVLIDVLSGFRDVVAFDPLIRATQDYDRFVRKHAAMALGVLGDTRAVPALLPLLADEEPYVHEEAEEALRKLAPNLDDEGRAEVTEALQSRRRAW